MKILTLIKAKSKVFLWYVQCCSCMRRSKTKILTTRAPPSCFRLCNATWIDYVRLSNDFSGFHLQPAAELWRTQINVVKSKGILKAPSAAAIRQLTTDHSLNLGVDFTEGGKPENPEKNPRSTGANYYCNTAHTSSKFLRDPSSYNRVQPGLTWSSVVKHFFAGYNFKTYWYYFIKYITFYICFKV